ncbi:hypothetical protein CALCODRAFT_24291 [Calocera cornea HHB12733]|uniref:Uncharacterized protein n=1 Tax=Calocera cornea HHB12733 TaxID=1353952 RepID=A0A165J1J6_9BASI|nr:hypothetical protein CALCODRAFT_24291 [Calocera cornea HHB12733]
MPSSSQRYAPNSLPFDYDNLSIESVKHQLRGALLSALSLLPQHQPAANLRTRPRLYTGAVGHSVLYLRLYLQASSGALDLPPDVISPLPALVRDTLEPCLTYPVGALARAGSSDPEQRRTAVSFGQVGLLDTPIGPAVVELTRQLTLNRRSNGERPMGNGAESAEGRT